MMPLIKASDLTLLAKGYFLRTVVGCLTVDRTVDRMETPLRSIPLAALILSISCGSGNESTSSSPDSANAGDGTNPGGDPDDLVSGNGGNGSTGSNGLLQGSDASIDGVGRDQPGGPNEGSGGYGAANGSGGSGGADGSGGSSGNGVLADGGIPEDTSLYDVEGALGCEGVFNPDQVLDYELTGDWAALLAEPSDGTSTLVAPFELSCNGGTPLNVAVERKRGGGVNRIGINIDVNEYVAGQRYFGLKKLVFDNSVGCCEAEDASHDTMIREYLAWRMMARSNVIASRVVFANLHANGELVGVMLNVEAVDKTFVGDRFGDDDGWLYKKSGGPGDGLKTNEICAETTCPNPYMDWFCFWRVEGPGCSSPPADVATTLPDHLMLDQMLRFGAVNAIVANSDGPIFKENNYYVYDWPGKRAYIPWDLDTCMKETSYSVFAGGNSPFAEVLLPTWDDEYTALLSQLIAGPLSVSAIHSEAERLLSVAGDAIDADQYAPEPAQDMIDAVKSWWGTRHAGIESQIAGH
jgi:hypothetical protein